MMFGIGYCAASICPSRTGFDSVIYMTTHQQDSSQPQQSQLSPQDTGLGLIMVVMEEAVLAGIATAVF
jgi:hypothetical protein